MFNLNQTFKKMFHENEKPKEEEKEQAGAAADDAAHINKKKEEKPAGKVMQTDDHREGGKEKSKEEKTREALSRQAMAASEDDLSKEDRELIREFYAKSKEEKEKPLSPVEKDKLLELDKEKSELNKVKAKTTWTQEKAEEWIRLDKRRYN